MYKSSGNESSHPMFLTYNSCNIIVAVIIYGPSKPSGSKIFDIEDDISLFVVFDLVLISLMSYFSKSAQTREFFIIKRN